MSASNPEPSRRNVRLGCLLRVGTWSAPGHTVEVTPEGFRVQIARAPLGEVPPSGTQLSFHLFFPNQEEPLKGSAVIVWVNTDERDAAEAPAIGIGLRLVGGSATASSRLVSFIQGFRHTLLAIDKERSALRVINQTLEVSYRVLTCTTGAEALELLKNTDVSALLVGQHLEDGPGLGLLSEFSKRYPRAHVAKLLAYTGDLSAVLQEDGVDLASAYYLTKPFRLSELEQAVHRGVEASALAVENDRLKTELERTNQQLRRENVFLRRRVEAYEGFEHLIGESVELRRSFAELERMRNTDSTVHIQGETGTGKELVARALHFSGSRASGPFIAQNCAGMPESLLQSTLFGHRKGSFTGAVRDHPGVFEQADGGTLFLDEVAELSAPVQAALLRALDGEVTPVGASQSIRVNVRIISATHADLRALANAGRFREDVYFRLVVLCARLPALRDRAGDIPLLAQHFLGLYCERLGKPLQGFDAKAMRLLEGYAWPGNVRELENEIERLVVLSEDGSSIDEGILSPHIRSGRLGGPPQPQDTEFIEVLEGLSYDESLERLEKGLLQRAFLASNGSLREAAALLKMERSRLGKVRVRAGLVGQEEP